MLLLVVLFAALQGLVAASDLALTGNIKVSTELGVRTSAKLLTMTLSGGATWNSAVDGALPTDGPEQDILDGMVGSANEPLGWETITAALYVFKRNRARSRALEFGRVRAMGA